MGKKFIKITTISLVSLLTVVYGLFLVLPFFVNGILNKHSEDIVKLIEDSTGGYKVELSNMKVLTTPKLTAGFSLGSVKINLPNGHEMLSADNFEIKMSLLPIFARKIELDKVSVENAKLTFEILKDGRFMFEDFLPKPTQKVQDETSNVEPMSLPFGLRLSNRLPNIYLSNYDITFLDVASSKKYYLNGDKFNLTDFILDKKVKLNANGEFVLDDEKQFSYDVKVKNHIMPNLSLHDLVFPQTPQIAEDVSTSTKSSEQKQLLPFNIIDIFEAIHKNQLTANLNADIKTYGTFDDINYDGKFSLDGMSVAVDGKKLPSSFLTMESKGQKTKLSSVFYTSISEDERTSLDGVIKTGKNPEYNLNFTSNAGVNNILNLVDSLAKSFGIKELATLSGSGKFDANFSFVGNSKAVKSSGYLKLPEASVKYGLYNISIDNINADVLLQDNNVNIKNVSFSILEQPLTFNGTISSSAVADLHLIADKLPLKGLILAAGQTALLKDNKFNSGTLSMDATVKGKLTSLSPSVDLSIDDVNIKNIPSNTSVKLTNSTLNVTTDGKTFKGIVNANTAVVDNPIAKITVPQAKITIGEKNINIDNAYALLDNSRIDVTGAITDYMTKNFAIDIKANGNLVANDLKNMIPKDFQVFVGDAKGSMPLNAHITGDLKAQNIDVNLTANPQNYFSVLDIDLLKAKSTTIKSSMKLANDNLKFTNTGIYTGETAVAILDGSVNNISKSQKLALDFSIPRLIGMPIPGFSKDSLVTAKGNLSIGGTALNPTLKGVVTVPDLKIPEMLFAMSSTDVTLDGALANGKGTVKRMTSGGIAAENLAADFTFDPKTNVFYLKNVNGTAFDGKVGGNISYNILNGKIGLDFTGSDLNAITAIEGAAGIKNALSGALGFHIVATLSGATDVEMIKNLKGNLDFEVTDGAFMSIGRIENLVAANNVMANVVMKATVASLSTIPVVKNSANFKYIKGEMTFDNGWANLTSIKTSGESMAYYITGKYNILNGSANLIILGRLGSDIVAVLGPVGELSLEKLTSFIPKFGAATANIINTMTSNPNSEKISEIPELSSNNEVYKDFKVTFNGGIESSSSVKSFKWLSQPDMSALEAPTLKEQVQTSSETIKKDVANTIEAAKKQVEDAKAFKEQSVQDVKEQVQNMKDSVKEIKNLFKF